VEEALILRADSHEELELIIRADSEKQLAALNLELSAQ
jgi:hypothetical protein